MLNKQERKSYLLYFCLSAGQHLIEMLPIQEKIITPEEEKELLVTINNHQENNQINFANKII